ncbi:MAG: cytochrome P450 [Dehalococcoidia bacterium]
MTQTLALADIDLSDPEIFQKGIAHEAFRVLRREAPVHWYDGNDRIKGFWSLTKYEDVHHVSRNPELFISSRGITQVEPREPTDEGPIGGVMGRMMIMMDPPEHVRVRRLVNKGFTPRAIREMEAHIREITTGIIDEVAPKGRCDFVTDMAAQLPLAVICEMMGVPRESWQRMFDLTNRVLGSGDPEYQVAGDEEGGETIRAGMMEIFQTFVSLVAERRAEPRQDLVSVIVGAEIDGQQLSDGDILMFCLLLIIAGNETTRNAISGGLLALDAHPEQKRKLLEDASLMPSAVEEILRWTSPVAHMARVATRDTEVRGQRIGEGERVVMWYPSVNRDEDVFPDPDRFDITRSPNDHLAFGIGEHFCLGANLARLELKVMFEELLQRLPGIRVAGPVELLRSNFIAGIKHIPVEF